MVALQPQADPPIFLEDWAEIDKLAQNNAEFPDLYIG